MPPEPEPEASRCPEEEEELADETCPSESAASDDGEEGPPRRLVKIVVVGAKGLRRADWLPGQYSDPYCICSIPDRPELQFQTGIVGAVSAPTWNHEVIIEDFSPDDSLIFQVKDYDWFQEDESLGTATLESSCFLENGFDGVLKLSQSGKGEEDLPALLKVRVQVAEKRTCFQTRDIWVRAHKNSLRRSAPAEKRALRMTMSGQDPMGRTQVEANNRISTLSQEVAFRHDKGRRVFMFDPSSGYRISWDILGIFLVCIDLIWLPLQVFSPPQTAPFTVLSWLAVLFWTADVGVTLNTGTFRKGGLLVMDRVQVASLYFRRWLLPDVILVGIEWFFVVQSSLAQASSAGAEGAGAARATKWMRVGRILRLLRLMRLVKLRALLFMLQHYIDSEWMIIMFMVTKNLMTILILNHLIACLWFLVGSASDSGWVRRNGLEDEGLDLQYFYCLQWAMAQFTPGASPLQPSTIGERVFAVSVLALALVVATCFVSNITSTLSAVWSMKRQESTQALLLRKFLRQNNISRTLASRVTRYIDCVLELRQNKVHPSRVQYLSYLSGPLHVELQSELREPQLFVHGLFSQYKESSVCAFRELCTTALEQSQFAKNDLLFRSKAEAKYMYFINMGSLVYRHFSDGCPQAEKYKLEAGQWSSENALWMPWFHAGDMKALADVDITMLNATKFCDVTSSDPEVYRFTRRYCRKYVERLQQAASFDRSSVTDLQLRIRVASIDAELDGIVQLAVNEAVSLTPAARDVKEAEDMEAELIGFSDSDDSGAESPRAVRSKSQFSLLSWVRPRRGRSSQGGARKVHARREEMAGRRSSRRSQTQP